MISYSHFKLVVVVSLILITFPAEGQEDWENPQLVSKNTIPAHAYFVPFSSAEKALQQGISDRILSLDGMWKFHLANTPEKRPHDFYKENYSTKNWKSIKVPANWQTEGFDVFIFTDVEYPIKPNPPFVPKDFNPVGSYKRNFTLPENWLNQEIILHLGAVNSFFYLWINGQPVGLSKDSKTPAEFNITNYLKRGENSIALQVFRFSDGTYLEGQDMWKLSGIERSVYLISRPKLGMQDFFVKADLINNYKDGLMQLGIKLNRSPFKEEQGTSFEIKVMDETDKVLYQHSIPLTGDTLSFEKLFKGIKSWNAEQPNLYRLLITQFNASHQVVESFMQEIGFRKIEIMNGIFKVNGVAIKIKGVNRHEHDMYTGKVITIESMKRDIELMKQYNINAVRCSHYPNAEPWYLLCNRYGIYIVDEANIECDGMDFHEWKTLADRPEWKAAFLDRTNRMFQRDKNFCSIITWSLGNESKFGSNFEATYRYLKSVDNTRPVQYEEARDNNYTDIYCPMYKSLYSMLEYSKEHRKKPLIQCEYAHMMGNSGGNLKDDWDVFYQHQQLQGGFIWDFSDQTFKRKDKNGNDIWAYGKDLGVVGETSDTSFCADGIFAADRTPHPQAFEVKKVYQNIHFKPVEWSASEMMVTNYFDFSTLDKYRFVWKIETEGKVSHSETFSVSNLAPHCSAIIKLNLPEIVATPGAEYFLTIEAWTTEHTMAIPANYKIAEEQFKLPVYRIHEPLGKIKEIIIKEEDQEKLTIDAGKIQIVFSRISGFLSSYKINASEILKDEIRPNFWRPATDNDIGTSMQIKSVCWQYAGDKTNLIEMNFRQKDSSAIEVITRHFLKDVKSELGMTYIIKANGDIHISYKLIAGEWVQPEIPRIGLRCLLASSFNRFSWLGRGPFDNYCDRKYSANIGLYTLSVDSLFHPYPRAQESANRTDIRWMALQNKEGIGLMAISPYEHWLSGGALPFNMHLLDYDRKLKYNVHGGSIKGSELVWWNIDYAQMGVGGDNSWGAKPHSVYTIPYNNYSYEFILRPVFNHRHEPKSKP